MRNYEVTDEDGLYAYFVELGKTKLDGVWYIRDRLVKGGYPPLDVDLTMEICACVIGLVEEARNGLTDELEIGLTFEGERIDPSDCLGVVLNKDKNGFGFYTRATLT